MSTVLGIWHLVLEGGSSKTIRTPATVQISNVTYGEEIVDKSSRDVVKLSFESLTPDEDEEGDEEEDEDEEIKIATTVLCALTPGKVEQVSVNVVLDSQASFKFEATGKNTVYLTGNYIRQDDDHDIDSEDEYDSDEDAYDLREVSSDVEMHPDDLDSDNSRFEEVDDDKTVVAKSQKRSRDSDVTEATPKAEKKSKKQKAEGGKAVEVNAETSKEEKKEKKEKKDKKKEKAADDAKKPAEEKGHPKKTIAGGIVIQDAKIGTGPMAKKGNTVRMRYVGKLTNGKIFDKNTSGAPFSFPLGHGKVIKGWDEGIVGMQVGGERVLTIPAPMAYGSKKVGDIPANSTLHFEVKLLEIKSK